MGTTQTQRSTRFRTLTSGVAVHDVVDQCREAVLDLLAGVASGWHQVELDRWLDASYRSVTTHLGETSRSRTRLSANHRSSELLVEASLLDASDVVREMLASCSSGPQPLFVVNAVECGFVAGVRDRNGALGYLPVDVGEMDLVDRLSSLIAADYLTRPNDYRSLVICADCGGISFDCASCKQGVGQVACESGVVRREEGPSSYAIFPPRAR
jgi:hypothetical protein